MLNLTKPAIVRYSSVVLAVVLALLITTNVDFLFERSPFLLFFAAVILVTRFAGRGPGIATVILSVVTADFFIIPPIYSFIPNVDDSFRVGTFVLLALPISLLISVLQLREKKARETGARYRTLFEYSPDGIVITDPRANYLDANESMCRMLGYTREEIIGKNASEIVAPEEIPQIDDALGIIKSESAYQREWLFKRKDGSRFAGDVIATKMPDGNLLGVIRDVSERDSAQAIVRESESRLAGIIDSAMDAIITLDSGQKIVLFNAAAEMMFKCPAEEAMGQPIERFIPERFRATHSEHVRKFGETQVTTRSMKALGGIFGVRSDGKEFPIEASISQLESSGQKFFTVILRDITERTRAEARFRLAVESAPNAMVMADNDGKIILINSQTEKLFGYDRDELIGQAVELLVPERFRGRHPAHREGFAADPLVRTMGAGRDLFGLRKDGAEVPVEIGLNPIEMEGGTYVLSSIVDITARKQAEASVRQSQAQLTAMIGSAMDAIITIDESQRIILFNSAAEKLFGYTQDEALGQSIEKFIPERFRHSHSTHVQTFGKANVTRRTMGELGAIFGLRSNGEEFPIEASISQIETAGKKFFTVILRDITQRKLAEAAVLEAKDSLEQRVSERTVQLEAANKELESFSYSVSHDLRSPLRHIDGFVQLLAKREAERLDDTSLRYLTVVSDAVGKMGSLIDELLAFSRTSRVEMKTAKVDLNALVAQVKSELEPEIVGRKIKWKIADLPPVEGDAVLLDIVITNLLSNAIKYTRGRTEAHIEIGISDETDREVTIFVKDDGAGFDMKYADKLFGVFQRLHRDDEFEGIGIGLATVQRIVHRHGGKIWPESEPDKGATFYMTLRRTKGETK